MATPLYTGKGQQVPRSEGRALQAISQFGQDEQRRSTQKLQQAYSDRDKVAKLMELDPVYATSQALQQKIGGVMDSFLDEANLFNKKRKGVLSTQDLISLQQSKGRAMAEMGLYKAIDDEMRSAAQKVHSRPDLYDEQEFYEAMDEVNRTGMPPAQGFLFKAVEDPYTKGLGLLKWDEKEDFLNTVDGRDRYQVTGSYNLQNQHPEDVVDRMMAIPGLQYDIQMSFDRQKDEGEKKRWLDEAGGNETAAANMQYRDKMLRAITRQKNEIKTKRSYRPQEFTQGAKMDMKYTSNTEQGWIGDATTGKRDVIYDSDTGEITFTNEITEPVVSIPVGSVKFDKDVDTGEMDEIKLIPQRSMGSNKIEWRVADDVVMIDKGLTREEGNAKYPNWSKMTKKSRAIPVEKQKEGLIKGKLLKQTEVKDETVWDVEVPLSGQVATTSFDDVSERLNAKYRQELKPFWREMMGGGKSKSTPKQQGSYSINGYDYSKQELLDAGYTEEQIKQLNGQ